MAESGFPEVNTKLWSGFFTNAKTPPAIAKKLETALRQRDPRSGSERQAQDHGGQSRRHVVG